MNAVLPANIADVAGIDEVAIAHAAPTGGRSDRARYGTRPAVVAA